MGVWGDNQYKPSERLLALDAVMKHKLQTQGQQSFEEVLGLGKLQYHFAQEHSVFQASASAADLISKIYSHFENMDSTIKYNVLSIKANELAGYKETAFEQRLQLAQVYTNTGKYRSIIELLEEPVREQETSLPITSIALGNFYLGSAYLFENDHIAAIKALEQSKKGIDLEANPFADFAITGYQAYSSAEAGLYKLSDSLFNRAFELMVFIDDVNAKCEIIQFRAKAYTLLGKYDEAINILNKQLKIPELSLTSLATVYQELGVINYDLGKYKEAIVHHKNAYSIFKQEQDLIGISSEQNNLARSYSALGQFGKALELYQMSLKTAQINANTSEIVVTYNNLGTTYWELGDNEKAISYSKKALKISKEINYDRQTTMSLYNLSLIYEDIDLDSVIYYKLESMRKYEEMGDDAGLADVYNDIGNLYHFDDAKGIEFHSESLKINRRLKRQVSIAGNLINLGHCYLSSDTKKAIQYYNEGCQLAKELGAQEFYKNGIISLTYVYFRNNELDSSRYYSNILVDIINYELEINFPKLIESEKLNYLRTFQEELLGLNHVFISDYDSSIENQNHLFELAIKYKGLLLQSAVKLKQKILHSSDTDKQARYATWLKAREKARDYSLTQTDRQRYQVTSDSLERILAKDTDLSFSSSINNHFERIQNKLESGEAAVEFIRYQEKHDTSNTTYYAAMVILQNKRRPVLLKICNEEDINTQLNNSSKSTLETTNDLYNGTALYDLAWAKIDSLLSSHKIGLVYYSPVGALNRVSITALINHHGKRLSQMYTMIQLSSTAEILNRKEDPALTNPSLLLYGGIRYSKENSSCDKDWAYLPGTLEEVSNISNNWPQDQYAIKTMTSHEATEASFKAQANEFTLIHVASHGFFFKHPDNISESLKKSSEQIEEPIEFRAGNIGQSFLSISNDPMDRSGLIFSGANEHCKSSESPKGDGILTANELTNLNLENVQLIVLSACETGLGDIVDNEGVFGLQRACKIAGAEKIIMSLWQIPDKATMEFMTLFYNELLSKNNIREAFRTAQNTMSKKYDPYFWAAFTLIE